MIVATADAKAPIKNAFESHFLLGDDCLTNFVLLFGFPSLKSTQLLEFMIFSLKSTPIEKYYLAKCDKNPICTDTYLT